MGNPLAWSPVERYQALQNLESALGSPDTNMFFTYNGAVYRSVSINSNGTMQVINQTTGQMSTLDPVDVYNGFQAASGNPIAVKTIVNPTVAPTGPSMTSVVMNKIGFYSGLVPMANQMMMWLASVHFIATSKAINYIADVVNFLGKAAIRGVLGGASAVMGAYGAFTGIQGMFKNGFTKMGLLGVGMSAFGVASGVNMALGFGMFNPAGWLAAAAVVSASIEFAAAESAYNHPTVGNISTTIGTTIATAALIDGTLAFSGIGPLVSLVATFPMIGPIIAVAIVAFAVLWAMFHQPPPEQIAAQNLNQKLSPIIWTPGPLLVVAVGTVALLMGWNKNRPAPAMASLTVPAYHLNEVLAASGVGPVDLKSKTPSVIVEPGTGNVIIVSPNGTDSHGNALVTLQSYQMAKNLQFVSSPGAPPDGAYIPFFRSSHGGVDTHPNPDLVKALQVENQMLMAVLSGTLLTHDALNALYVAAAANKYGVGVGG